jgi:hypothetical protein
MSGATVGIVLLTLLAVACRPASTTISVSGTDCGTTEESTPPAYSASARECLWSAYSSGRAAYWNARGVTIEGDPIPSLLSFDPTRGLDVTRDVTADKFSAQADRRVWSWHCTTLTKRTWATDASRYSFELGGCTGDGPATRFP